MAAITKRAKKGKTGNDQYQVRVRRAGYPAQSATFETRKEAEAWGRDVESKMDRGIFQDLEEAEKNTLGDVIDKFLKEFAPHQYKKRDDGKEAYKFQCAHLNNKLGKYSLAKLDQKLVTKYRDDRLADVWRGKPLSGSTVKKELNMLSKLLGYAEKELDITLPRGNPVKKVRMPSEGKGRDRRLTAEEWERLASECRASRNLGLWPAVQLAVALGARQGEILDLLWKDVDTKNCIALLRDTKNGTDRAVPLTGDALAVFKKLPVNINGRVIKMERMTLYHAFVAARNRAGIADYTFHDLRHEALSRLAERGDLTVLELASISGHRSLQMLQKYTHLQAAKLAKKLRT